MAYFIETTAIPDTTFRVIEPNSTEIIRYGSLNMVYGPSTGTISSHLGLPSNKIYVPADTTFQIEAQSFVLNSGENIHKTIIIENFKESSLSPGETAVIDLRSYSLPQGIATLQNATETAENLITVKEDEGFFLAVERQQLSHIKQTTNAAISLKDQEHYAEAFTKSREAYVLIADLENGLNNMLLDATRSVYILIGFIAITCS